MSKEFQIKDGDLIASFDLENEGGDIDFCDLFKISNGVANKIGTFIDYDVTNKIIGEQSKQISDLQSKLAESEKKAYSRGHSQRDIANEIKLNALREDVANKEKRIVELKQQLAEKDKQLENAQNLKAIEVEDELSLKLSKIHNQDKISFAVEQLEKAKSFCISAEDNGWCVTHKNWLEIVEYIDNQIKAIKGEK